MGTRTNRFLKEVAIMLLFLWIVGSVSGYYSCPKTGRYIDYYLGLEAEYYWGDESEDAVEWWAGETDDDGNCLEPLNTYSCDPLAWSTNQRNATLFTCSEADRKNGVAATCIDAAFACDGYLQCPNGEEEDEAGGGLNDCSEYECPYSELGGFKCDHSWAEWETKLCLHRSWMCDHYDDCVGGEDEPEDECGSGSGDYYYYY